MLVKSSRQLNWLEQRVVTTAGPNLNLGVVRVVFVEERVEISRVFVKVLPLPEFHFINNLFPKQ